MIFSLAEEDGYVRGRGTMGGEQVHYNRELLKGFQSFKGGGVHAPGAPLVPLLMFLINTTKNFTSILRTYCIYMWLCIHEMLKLEGCLILYRLHVKITEVDLTNSTVLGTTLSVYKQV